MSRSRRFAACSRAVSSAAESHLLASDEHTIDLGDSHVGGNTRLIVHVAVAFAFASFVGGNFTGQNIPEQGKGVIEGLRIDADRTSAGRRIAILSYPAGVELRG